VEDKMVRAFVAIGSNIDPAMNLQSAVNLLAHRLTVTRVSTVYRTEPEERPEQSEFYNCVVEVQTDLPPLDLKFQVLRPIETQLKRWRTSDKYAPRTIDLDLILYGDVVLAEDDLVLPDPEIIRRFFLAVPLAELEPDLILPGINMRISGLAAHLPGRKARALRTYTAQLRQQLFHREKQEKANSREIR
jgi:dihydroneopterin aldolase/2-amino-4-hydroxy-6-hydroxymethyldihydropteridine diphosphokinase